MSQTNELNLNIKDSTLDGKNVKDELEGYIEAVKQLAELNSDFMFNNSSPKHAAIVLSVMMENAGKEFLIYDDNLKGDLEMEYKGFLPSLIKYVRKDGVLKIVIDDNALQDSDIYKTLKELKGSNPKNVFVKVANKEFTNVIQSRFGQSVNFAVTDNSFRLEESDIKGTAKRKAICSFNNSKISGKLRKVFEDQFDYCPDFF